jgi:HK97 family phage prohead protease
MRGVDWEFRSLGIDRKVLSAGGFSGYASVFHTVDGSWGPDIIQPGAFADSLGEFLETGFVGGMNHDWDHPIGRPMAAREDAYGLWVEAALTDTPAAREVRQLIEDGVVQRLSIGFQVVLRRRLEPDGIDAYWKQWGYEPTSLDRSRATGEVRLIEKARLLEFSPVAVAANELARICPLREEAVGRRGLAEPWERPSAEGSGRAAVAAARARFLGVRL